MVETEEGFPEKSLGIQGYLYNMEKDLGIPEDEEVLSLQERIRRVASTLFGNPQAFLEDTKGIKEQVSVLHTIMYGEPIEMPTSKSKAKQEEREPLYGISFTSYACSSGGGRSQC